MQAELLVCFCGCFVVVVIVVVCLFFLLLLVGCCFVFFGLLGLFLLLLLLLFCFLEGRGGLVGFVCFLLNVPIKLLLET